MKYKYHRIKDLREENDLTQEYIARKLKTYTTTYQRWERGDTEIPVHIIIKLCEYYNISADYILGFTNKIKTLPKDGNPYETYE